MAKQLVNTGSTANDGTGDTLRVAFSKVNDNTDELYSLVNLPDSSEWAPNTIYQTGDLVLVFELGDTFLRRHTAGTSRATLDATELSYWDYIGQRRVHHFLGETLYCYGQQIYSQNKIWQSLSNRITGSSFDSPEQSNWYALTSNSEGGFKTWTANTFYSINDLIFDNSSFIPIYYRVINSYTSGALFSTADLNNLDLVSQERYSGYLPDTILPKGFVISFNDTLLQKLTDGITASSFDGGDWSNLVTRVQVSNIQGSVPLWDNSSYSFIPALVSNSSLANMPSATLKGRFSSTTGSPQNISIGSGLNLDSSTGILTSTSNAAVIQWANINSTPFNALVNNYYLVNTDVGTLTISLPTAVGNNGSEITFKKINVNTNNAVIIPQSGQTIDGASSKSLIFQWDVLTVRSNGSNWLVLTEFPTRVVVKPIHSFTRTGSTQSFNAGTLTTVVFNNNVGSSGISNVSLNTSDGTFTFSKVGNYSMSGVLDMTSATANARGLLQLVSSGAGINGYLFSSIQLCSTANTSSPIHFNINFNISIVGDLLLRLTMGAAATLNNISGTGGNTIISRLTITELA